MTELLGFIFGFLIGCILDMVVYHLPIILQQHWQVQISQSVQFLNKKIFLKMISAIVSVIIIHQYGLNLKACAALIFSWSLLILAFIDIKTFLLPDVITLPLLWLGLLCNLFGLFADIHSAVLGAVVGYLSLYCITKVFQLITGKIGMGNGDFKLLAALGAWLGWQYLVFIVLFASLLGSIVGISFLLFKKQKSNTPIPFGPYLALAGWIVLLGNKV